MQKDKALALRGSAEETARKFSNKDRGGNVNGEDFIVHDIVVLGETTAAVVFLKSSGKKAVAFFYFVNGGSFKRWEYFFITYAHLASLNKVAELLFDVEQHNFEVNFEEPILAAVALGG